MAQFKDNMDYLKDKDVPFAVAIFFAAAAAAAASKAKCKNINQNGVANNAADGND
ncbi:hypothetical protein KKC1_22290 [Calderihabitans maritimus]|uniref:Uncharacterized protein n=2 Tax=Calderihabitans maritimus TaxID=1246530 RepID=A0A1Z5HUK4_9FIRM|nr:hypothetical protein KKC1_22290 [Calderihabitans maritimus]